MDIMQLTNVSNDLIAKRAAEKTASNINRTQNFSDVFHSALSMIDDTNQLQMDAETAKLEFAMGESQNTHDLVIAQQKAAIALQYTVAVKNEIIDAYKQIMQMQI